MIRAQILVIDNYDSFTWNLVHYLMELGAEVKVVRNDAISARQALSSGARGFLISPGPKTPDDAGISLDLVAACADAARPLLGVCLGHQAMVEQAGGAVERAPEPVHGKVSMLDHDKAGPLRGLESPLGVGRYHSLCTRTVPDRFHVHAEIDGMAMAVSDARALQTGLQFHPESILTRYGDRILANVLEGS